MSAPWKIGVFGLAMSVVALSSPASAELATWDQARVTELAQQLVKATDAWQLAVREQPGLEVVGSGDSEEGFGLVMKARVLNEQAQALAGHLAKGEGYDKTHNYYRSLKELIDDTEVLAQQAELDEPTMDAWAKVADLQRQIAPYYDPKANQDAAE